ncbi:hypothetical protein [Chryseosolibacter indicus]|uniref:Adhesin domain-containing protein n=1 Tax=Chryseosolibacter indicus TaxID=2782351 RepID=A0ABS5VSJ4_9BACT|nr:hypothetical protein [Chryseosolibacter indicus]MBT1703844.1 hypothetical protein [Chryseosolibacter indicus]
MKSWIFITQLIMLVCCATFAQTAINKTIPLQNGQSIVMHFDYPELVKVTTWEKNEILITGTVSINEGENDDAFTLDNVVTGKTVTVRSEIKNLKSLPVRIVVDTDGQKIVFKDKAALKKYQSERGRSYNSVSYGPEIDIVLEVKVPRNVDTKVESIYGMVEVTKFDGPLSVEATYGGVDAALAEKTVGEVTAETNYGNIYTNLDVKFGENNLTNGDFHTVVAAKLGSGPKYSFESKYGNVYIRKATSN